MKTTLTEAIDIRATPERIWAVLLNDDTYRQWTAAFHPGSYAESDWQEGSKALFKTPEGDGMVSKVLEHKPMQVISFLHVGLLKNHMEDYDNPELINWKDSKETYRLSHSNGISTLTIEQDIPEQYVHWFTQTWHAALEKIKALAEAGA